MLNIKYILLSTIMLFLSGTLLAQRENKYIRRGNSDFEEKNYTEAEKDYLRSLSKGGKVYKGLFNLGDVYYELKDYRQAGMMFDSVARLQVDGGTRSGAFYNLGNTLLSASIESDTVAAEALPLSIESYKEALRINPTDTAAKYNLAYAQLLLNDQQQQQQQNQDQNQNQDQQDKQDQQDQQQDQQQDEQDKQDQQQDKQQDQQQESQQQQQQQPQSRQISKEDAERMLEAMKNDEKKTLEKVKVGKAKGKVVKSEKDW
jgi:Ca-activated chloride channel family protein